MSDGTQGHVKEKLEYYGDQIVGIMVDCRHAAESGHVSVSRCHEADDVIQAIEESDLNEDQIEWNEYCATLRLMALAQTAPHDCGDESCPGVINKRKLEELTALREKLAAAEASLAERGRMLETTHRVQRSYRATVAAALAELRAQWNAQYQDYVSKTDDSSWERRQELLDRMRELDAVIAKLDLAEKEQPK